MIINTVQNIQHTENAWWGRHRLAEGGTLRWRIGPLTLWLQRLALEWRVAYARNAGADEAVVEAARAVPAEDQPDSDGIQRYMFRHTGENLHVLPALADRPVVTRPVSPVHIPAGEDVTFFVSSPLWLRVCVHDPERLLFELPVQTPSETWFGPSTLQGEICYASETSCRLSWQELPLRPHRAVTPVVIRNRGGDALLLERLNLPVNYLSLFAEPGGGLWTQTVTMEREGEALASVDIAKAAPSHVAAAELLAGPRRQLEKNVFNRALNALFG